MIKIGLIGEDPNDTKSIANLLNTDFASKATFIFLLKNIRGHQLDNNRTAVSLKIEVANKKPDIVVFIRDADATRTEANKLAIKKAWFDKLGKNVQTPRILLLNIFELEALILADIDAFNKLYNTDIKFTGDVTMVEKPKEFLMEKTRKLRKMYAESHCPNIFAHLNLKTVRKRCEFFNSFVNNLEEAVSSK